MFRPCGRELEFLPLVRDPKIQNVVLEAHNELCQKVMKVQMKLIQPISRHYVVLTQEMAESLWSEDDPTLAAPFFRALKYQVDGLGIIGEGCRGICDPYMQELKEALQDLMVNNLYLDRLGIGPGSREDSNDDYFLCADIEDDKMPWNFDDIDS